LPPPKRYSLTAGFSVSNHELFGGVVQPDLPTIIANTRFRVKARKKKELSVSQHESKFFGFDRDEAIECEPIQLSLRACIRLVSHAYNATRQYSIGGKLLLNQEFLAVTK
jgi:hypothetical protein